MKITICLLFYISFCVLSGCGSIPIQERDTVRQEINSGEKETLAKFMGKGAEQQQLVDTSSGYFIGRVSGAKVPILGLGSGLGVLYDKQQKSRTYMNIKRLDVGVGLGAGEYHILILFEDYQALEKYRSGVAKPGVGIDLVAGEQGVMKGSNIEESVTMYLLPETGVKLTANARLFGLSINEDLTDTGVSRVSIPNSGFSETGEQGEDAPRIWEHKLPFFAQDVIDKGYDLPLPYGIGINYAYVDQELLLSDIEVGINGRDKESFEFVGFENASAHNNSVQFKADTWLLPFLNVFALLGRIDGKAPVDVIVDGNGWLDQLGIDCRKPPADPVCSRLQDQTFTLPINADFSGTTYGIGTIIAGGWNDWFVALPLSFTYADMDTTQTEGIAITFTPRVGYVFNMNKWGSLAFYGGGNLLHTELTITGTESTPGDEIVIDYTIQQKNRDKWNLLLGGNWDINKHWSWMFEYNGFIGSRTAFITSLEFRF